MGKQSLKKNYAHLVGEIFKCTAIWHGRQANCKFFTPTHAGIGEGSTCKWGKKLAMNDSLPSCTHPDAQYSNTWQTQRGSRRNFSHPRKLDKEYIHSILRG